MTCPDAQGHCTCAPMAGIHVEILGIASSGGVWLLCRRCQHGSSAAQKMTVDYAARWAEQHFCEKP